MGGIENQDIHQAQGRHNQVAVSSGHTGEYPSRRSHRAWPGLALGLLSTLMVALQFQPLCPPAAAAAAASRETRIYILRGLADVFSLGMNGLASKLSAEGYPARAYPDAAWPRLVEDLDKEYRSTGRYPRIVIIGHSLGANDAVRMANRLGERSIEVRLVVTFDPSVPLKVGSNVRRAVNFFLPRGVGRPLTREPGDRGTLANDDITGLTDHMTMDSSVVLWERTVEEVRKAVR